jgi:putative transposase
MTRLEDRQILVRDIEQAHMDGARLAEACALAGIDARTLRRWKVGDGLACGDRRPGAARSVLSHALSEAERARIIAIANEPRFAETPPARIVPALADEGIYIASESSFHRVLRAHGQMNRRGRAQPPRTSRPPTTHIATHPGDVWCWDVTFLPAQIQGRWYYFYLIVVGVTAMVGCTLTFSVLAARCRTNTTPIAGATSRRCRPRCRTGRRMKRACGDVAA